MAEISKHIPKNVKPRKELGFGRPATDIIDCSYEARVHESSKKGIGSLVFFDITTREGSFAWGINASDLLGLEKHPVGADRIGVYGGPKPSATTHLHWYG